MFRNNLCTYRCLSNLSCVIGSSNPNFIMLNAGSGAGIVKIWDLSALLGDAAQVSVLSVLRVLFVLSVKQRVPSVLSVQQCVPSELSH